MIKTENECWIFVPGTDSRYAVSNQGRLMKVARKRRYARRMLLEGCMEIVPLVSDYRSEALGWYAWFDNESHFYGRDELMKLFPEELRDVDRSLDQAAVERRAETFKEALSGRDG